MSKNNINQLYKSAWYFMRKTGRETLDLDDKVYHNLIFALLERTEDNQLCCFEIIEHCTDIFLNDDFGKDKVEQDRGENLVEYIINTFELNKKTHYLLIPINGAILRKDVHFSSFHFIVGNEEEKEAKIQNITKLDKQKIHDFIDHTKESRSEGFMAHTILVLQIDNVPSNVYDTASTIAQRIFQILKLMAYKYEAEESLFELASPFDKNNFHVAIIGEEDRQFGHGNWWDLIQCKYSLDFLSEKHNQSEFVNLANVFIFENHRDELYYKFTNALKLFEKSLEQYENNRDVTLSLMLLFSAAESLLTENEWGKMRRLSGIWPRLVTVTGKSQEDLSSLITDFYKRRNAFVHAGNLTSNGKNEKLRVLHQMLAKLISVYLSTDIWKSENNIRGTNEKDITIWRRYIGNVFTDAKSDYLISSNCSQLNRETSEL